LGFTPLEGQTFSEQKQNELFGIIDKIPNTSLKQKGDEWVYCNIIKDSPTIIDDVMNALKLLFNA
jgi:hypothetical protein